MLLFWNMNFNPWHLLFKKPKQVVGNVKDNYVRPWRAATGQTRQH